MTDTIDCYYWISSDWAYFGNPRMKALADRYGLPIRYRPIDLATVYQRTGGIPLRYRSRERRAYRFVEMRRFSERLGMPIVLEPRHPPADGRLPSFMVIAAAETGADVYALNHAIMVALWVEDRDIEDPAVLAEIATQQGFDGPALLEAARRPAAEASYAAFTDEAIDRGVWGAPFYFFRDEPFWGQDRLDMLAEAVAAVRQPI